MTRGHVMLYGKLSLSYEAKLKINVPSAVMNRRSIR